jgi:hypothetical protein
VWARTPPPVSLTFFAKGRFFAYKNTYRTGDLGTVASGAREAGGGKRGPGAGVAFLAGEGDDERAAFVLWCAAACCAWGSGHCCLLRLGLACCSI